MDLLEELVEHGVAVAGRHAHQGACEAEEAEDEDDHTVEVALVRIYLIHKLSELLLLRLLIRFQARQHVENQFRVNLVLRVGITLLVEVAAPAILILLAALAFDDDALDLELVDLLLVQVRFVEVDDGEIIRVERLV